MPLFIALLADVNGFNVPWWLYVIAVVGGAISMSERASHN